nr:PIN domain-containing protein [Natrinema sp. 1APR25-10V2]
MTYAETDFLLALIKDDDWLQEAAERVYERRKDELWIERTTLIELMLVSYREGWNVLRTVTAARSLVEIRDDTEDILAAASYVQDDGFTPLDALHLVTSGDDPIVSSESDYDGHSERVKLEDR